MFTHLTEATLLTYKLTNLPPEMHVVQETEGSLSTPLYLEYSQDLGASLKLSALSTLHESDRISFKDNERKAIPLFKTPLGLQYHLDKNQYHLNKNQQLPSLIHCPTNNI